MKNIYLNSIANKLKFSSVVLLILLGISINASAQVKKAFTQRTSQFTPTKKIYNVKGDFTMLGNTCLTPQNYTATTNNNGQFMTYVDTDGDANTFNSSSSTLVLSTENGAVPSCSNIIYAGLYWTGKSSPNPTFNVTKSVPNGTQAINNNLNVVHNQNIANTNYTLSVTRGGSSGNRNPIYTFSGNGFTYAFRFFNSSAPNRVTLSINGGAESPIPATINGAGTQATLTTPYAITDGNVVLTIKKLIRDAGTNLSSGDTQDFSNADVNVTGTVTTFANVTKTFNKRIVSLKGPASSSYTQITAAATDIYYPSGTDDDIYSAYAEITNYVRTNGIGQYTLADMALLEGNVGGTGYSGGWGMIVIYENSKMKWRDVTIFDGYAYVVSSNTSGHDLPVSGFNTVQTGNVGLKLGFMASEGDVSFTGDYFRIRNLNSTNYTDLSHSGNSTTNFFNSSINVGGTRNPNLVNNTGIDIAMFNVPNSGNTIIGNGQTSTNFRYGTSGDTYSIFGIAMSVDAFVPEVEGVITTTTINGSPAIQPYTILPNQEAGFSVDIKNIGTEPINNYKLIIPIPYNASYVPGSAVGTIFSPQTTPTPNNISFNPSLGVTGSLVWDFGTLVLPPNPNTILAKLTFKLSATSNCSILNNASCSGLIAVSGYSTGVSGITSVNLNNTPLIQGFTTIGSCLGEPIPAPINLTIDGSSYVSQNCSGDNILRNFTYCSEDTTVGTSNIASNFPPGSLFFNEFPVTINSIQYSDNNPIPLIAGSTVTYYAVPAGGGNGCNFPFTISKCPTIVAEDDTISGGNGTTGNSNIGNILTNNGNGNDTVNGNPATINQVNISIVTPATPIGGNPVPLINILNGQVSVPPGTPAGTYTIVYQICDILNPTNCDQATVTIQVTCPNVPQPTLACYESANFNTTTCAWDVTGTQPAAPTGLACYESANFNTTTCAWDVTGTQPAAPTGLACYESANFNTTTCAWDVTGTQPAAPTGLACYESANFNTTTCAWDVTGTQPAAPTGLACYESANFNTTTCAWDVTGTQPAAPTGLACYESANFNTTTCAWDVTGTQPAAPTGLACYETATFNTTTCVWDVTGTMPVEPTVACYETATFNTTTCVWDVTGTMPVEPTVACYETATFNTTTCAWDVTGTQPVQPAIVYCWDNFVFNTTTCVWDNTGVQPVRNIAVASQCNNDNLLSVDILDLINTDFPGVATVTGTWSVSPATSGLNTTTGEFVPFGLPSGNYVVTYNNNDPACPGIVTITIPVDDTCVVLGCDTVEIHNAFTPNGDGINEWFQIDNIEQPCHLPNTVEIYNRWGVLVYETKNYDNNTRRFEGVSEGRTTVNKSSELPTGTYFYIIQWTDGTQKVTKDGYLYLTR